MRKVALTVHLTSSVGWIGAVVVYLALGVAAVTSRDVQTVRGAWIGMELAGWIVIVPLALLSLFTGLVMAMGSRWGLFRHYWVAIAFLVTAFNTVILIVHMPTVSAETDLARRSNGAQLQALGGDLFHPGLGLVLLLAVQVLNIYKPPGLTRYGWRKRQEQLRRQAQPVLTSS